MVKSKPKKKIKTLDDFAAAIHEDYLTIDEKVGKIHHEMVTIRDEMVTKGEFKEVRDDVKRITDAMVSKADLEETIRDEFGKSRHAKHIEDLRSRVGHIEEKLGIW